MKKTVTMLLLLVMMVSLTAAYAEDLGVQIIGGPDANMEAVSLDDMQLGVKYTIDGYAEITPTFASFVDYFGQFDKDANYNDVSSYYSGDYVYYTFSGFNVSGWGGYYKQASWQDSGLNADFYWLCMDITNTQMKTIKYMEDISVKMVYKDVYEFNGWVRQANFDYSTVAMRRDASTTGGPYVVLHPSNEEGVPMMYTGHFVFGCTLPVAVVNDTKAPLKMIVTIGGNELTYYVHK